METLAAAAKRLAVSRCQQWLLVVLTGCAAAVMSFTINVGVEAMDKLRYSLAFKFIHPRGKAHCSGTGGMLAPAAIARFMAVAWLHLNPAACSNGLSNGVAGCNPHAAKRASSHEQPAVCPAGGFLLPWLVFNATSCAISAVAALGVVYLSPLAAGSGIPHIKAYCNGIEIPGLLVSAAPC